MITRVLAGGAGTGGGENADGAKGTLATAFDGGRTICGDTGRGASGAAGAGEALRAGGASWETGGAGGASWETGGASGATGGAALAPRLCCP